LTIEASLIKIFDSVKETKQKNVKRPIWVKKLEALLQEEEMDYSLKKLSSKLDIHPIHLSREFSRYFGTNLGSYIRFLKLNKAFYLLTSNKFSMTEICYKCGFYDQSHFIANFKSVYKTTPYNLLKQISK
jgi:AraC-like DNA-binding protein